MSKSADVTLAARMRKTPRALGLYVQLQVADALMARFTVVCVIHLVAPRVWAVNLTVAPAIS